MAILQVSPETVRSRLEEIRLSPDMAPVLKLRKLPTHLLYHTKAKTRLSFLKDLKLKCVNLRVLGE